MTEPSPDPAPRASFAVLAPHFPPATAGGGPIRSLDALTATCPAAIEVAVLTSDRDAGAREPLPVPSGRWTRHGTVPVLHADTTSPLALARAFRSLRRRRPTHVYVNSVFNAPLSLLPQLLGRLGSWHGARVVVAPRGELGPWALRSKRGKKRVCLAAYRHLGLHRGVVWHAATEAEAADVRALWGDDAIVVVDRPMSPLPPRARREAPGPSPVVRAVSHGRLTRLKGLDLVLRGLAGQPAGTRLHLDVHGPAEEGSFVAECHALAEALPAGVTVAFRGLLPHDDVQATLARHDVALLGTHGESFGHALAEALSVGCPVLVADTTPWTPAVSGGAGLVVPEPTAPAWTATIARFLSLADDERLAMRRAAAAAFERSQAAGSPHLFEQVLVAEAAEAAAGR